MPPPLHDKVPPEAYTPLQGAEFLVAITDERITDELFNQSTVIEVSLTIDGSPVAIHVQPLTRDAVDR